MYIELNNILQAEMHSAEPLVYEPGFREWNYYSGDINCHVLIKFKQNW
jgi:hypothetical protein